MVCGIFRTCCNELCYKQVKVVFADLDPLFEVWSSVSFLSNLFLKFCLFELMLYVPVNRKGHVGTLPPFYETLTQH